MINYTMLIMCDIFIDLNGTYNLSIEIPHGRNFNYMIGKASKEFNVPTIMTHVHNHNARVQLL